jgi:hypothetical protein
MGMQSRCSRIVIFLISFCAVASGCLAHEVVERGSKGVCQSAYGEYACAPASIVNSLLFGDPLSKRVFLKVHGDGKDNKLRYIASRWVSRESTANSGKKLFVETGLDPFEIPKMYNMVLDEFSDGDDRKVRGCLPTKEKAEGQKENLDRVHNCLRRSLKSGIPPLLSITSLGPEFDATGKFWHWKPLCGHTVTVVEVSADSDQRRFGFLFEFIAPEDGERREGYIFSDTHRSFEAKVGTEVINHPYLQVVVPTMSGNLDKLETHLRGFMIVHYITAHERAISELEK